VVRYGPQVSPWDCRMGVDGKWGEKDCNKSKGPGRTDYGCLGAAFRTGCFEGSVPRGTFWVGKCSTWNVSLEGLYEACSLRLEPVLMRAKCRDLSTAPSAAQSSVEMTSGGVEIICPQRLSSVLAALVRPKAKALGS
jgi:hypothetical protein